MLKRIAARTWTRRSNCTTEKGTNTEAEETGIWNISSGILPDHKTIGWGGSLSSICAIKLVVGGSRINLTAAPSNKH